MYRVEAIEKRQTDTNGVEATQVVSVEVFEEKEAAYAEAVELAKDCHKVNVWSLDATIQEVKGE